MDLTPIEETGCDWGEKTKERRNYVPIKARDPRGGDWSVLFQQSRFAQSAGRPWAANTLGYLVPYALQNPKAIFVGIREDPDIDDDCWLCYVARPTDAYYPPDGHVGTPPEDQVFIVYVTDERVIYSWRWEHCDDDHPYLPEFYALGRYKKQVL